MNTLRKGYELRTGDRGESEKEIIIICNGRAFGRSIRLDIAFLSHSTMLIHPFGFIAVSTIYL
ncbi:hypothetical protein K503DRAFT_776073 [Rhizopogon vinicolor AM-OR11-026]|uniref:Uncharacterized protein n=1 Tax=Rhizopogon vinicolor AM-OR11-026 TaxID=1314800 RepID=A0A1B7MK95_9AGAM|nr:hypothetical protein K503DRAFT_776073 [Rhizopogon vinicolor AM-OR11-026]